MKNTTLMPDCKDLANAELIVRAVNEYAALVAVAEAGQTCADFMSRAHGGEGLNDDERWSLVAQARNEVREALANLAAVRGGK